MKLYVFLFLFLTVFFYKSYGQGKIDKAEDRIKKTEKTSNSSYSKSTYINNTNNSEGDFFTDIIGGLFIQIFAYTAYGIAFESPFETDHKGSHAFLTKHPYKNTTTGNYSYDWNEDTEIFTTTITNQFIFETNKIYGNHLNVDMKFLKRLGVELDYLQLWEENTNFGNDALAIYTVLAKYNRVRTERFNAWWGLGAAYVDGGVNELGFTYGLGAELFFIKPFSMESNFNQTLINDNSINTFNALLNYHRKQYKFTLGYEHLKIGGVGFSTFTTGVGVSF
ncbi:MAG: hypothetical protein ABJK28_19105 [Algibacter sp.]